MRAAAVAVLLVAGTVFASLAVGGAASATCPTPNPSQTSSSVGVQIGSPSDTPTPNPAPTCTPDATSTPSSLPTPGPSIGTATGSTNGATGGGNSGTTPAPHAKPAAANTPQAAPAGATGAPSPGNQPVSKADPLTVSPASARAGQKVLVTSAGFAASEKVQIVLYPSPVILGSYLADSTGALRVTLTLPIQTTTGPHTVEATGWVSHHAANGSLLVISAAGLGSGMSSGWILAAGGLLLLLIVVTVLVFRSSIARIFTPPRLPEPVL